MPELPEVETTRRGIAPSLTDRTITRFVLRQGSLRWPVPAELTQLLPGLVISGIQRRSKYLLLTLTRPQGTPVGTLLIHLGMSGSLRLVSEQTPPRKHDHIDLVLDEGTCLRYHDPRRFGAWLWTTEPPAQHPLLKKLGPEPLSDDFDGTALFDALSRRKSAIKTCLMNAQIVVGVGNIYANEALFLTGLHPQTPAHSLTLAQCDALAGRIRHVLQAAIDQGGTTLNDFLSPDGTPGYFEQQLFVYGRAGDPCRRCAQPIEKRVLSQRATYFCPHCQPEAL
ncbi:bifunctional DNA-formamidopyrimidine glycosylase/DNA-(apurinic or apyrimidinic site) lyase [Hydrogenovibrio halophilus]|uniref:bifunctional DNA-formamidopyrimidine glycosylase/DNA-(apurinic or apyrimidinic site) lyase n=1 Tax=Hydrogenovibrio halophilus TaxID=373391 RepID=UPI00036BCDF8|nr:bifunctional DNA-formamidopyrimidine glycosylase/DNA-(apurinic or apyrimidinic site) lyase [Hydrogenovibrio halophilus]